MYAFSLTPSSSLERTYFMDGPHEKYIWATKKILTHEKKSRLKIKKIDPRVKIFDS